MRLAGPAAVLATSISCVLFSMRGLLQVGVEAMIALEESLTVNRSPDEKIRVRVKAPTKPHPTDKTV